MTGRLKALAFAIFLALPAAARAEEPAPPPELAPAVVKDLCNYLKDVEAKTDEACAPETLAALKKQDVAAFTRKLALVQKRKIDIQAAYDFLKALPPDGAAPPKTGASAPQPGPNPLQLEPPINERTFPVWSGAQVPEFKAVYARWLKAQNAELARERQGPVGEARKKEIAAKLARDESRLARLDKIKDPAELSCALGESCSARGEVSGPSVAATGAGRAWTTDDFARANAQALAQNRAPGGKLDRGIPSLAASAVIDNSPIGPLAGQPADKGRSPLRTAAELALVTTGGLLLFGGFGGRQLEEKFPGIRRNMGIAALVGGALATGALAWEAHLARLAAAALPMAANPAVDEEASDTLNAGSTVIPRMASRLPQSAAEGSRLQEHLRQWEKYGEAGFEELENGRIRYYGRITPSENPGTMVGRRLVREWDPATNSYRTWHETLDWAGTVRRLRPETGGPKVHYNFDAAGEYVGKN